MCRAKDHPLGPKRCPGYSKEVRTARRRANERYRELLAAAVEWDNPALADRVRAASMSAMPMLTAAAGLHPTDIAGFVGRVPGLRRTHQPSGDDIALAAELSEEMDTCLSVGGDGTISAEYLTGSQRRDMLEDIADRRAELPDLPPDPDAGSAARPTWTTDDPEEAALLADAAHAAGDADRAREFAAIAGVADPGADYTAAAAPLLAGRPLLDAAADGYAETVETMDGAEMARQYAALRACADAAGDAGDEDAAAQYDHRARLLRAELINRSIASGPAGRAALADGLADVGGDDPAVAELAADVAAGNHGPHLGGPDTLTPGAAIAANAGYAGRAERIPEGLYHDGQLDDAALDVYATLPADAGPRDVTARMGGMARLAADLDAAGDPDAAAAVRERIGDVRPSGTTGDDARYLTALNDDLARDSEMVAGTLRSRAWVRDSAGHAAVEVGLYDGRGRDFTTRHLLDIGPVVAEKVEAPAARTALDRDLPIAAARERIGTDDAGLAELVRAGDALMGSAAWRGAAPVDGVADRAGDASRARELLRQAEEASPGQTVQAALRGEEPPLASLSRYSPAAVDGEITRRAGDAEHAARAVAFTIDNDAVYGYDDDSTKLDELRQLVTDAKDDNFSYRTARDIDAGSVAGAATLDAWADSAGYVPATQAEARELARSMSTFLAAADDHRAVGGTVTVGGSTLDATDADIDAAVSAKLWADYTRGRELIDDGNVAAGWTLVLNSAHAAYSGAGHDSVSRLLDEGELDVAPTVDPNQMNLF